MKMRDIEKDDYIVNKIPHRYDPNASCPDFKNYLRGVVPDPGDREKLPHRVVVWLK